MTTGTDDDGAEPVRRDRRPGCARLSSRVGVLLLLVAAVLLGVGVLSEGLGRLLALASAALLVMFGVQALVLAGMLRWVRQQELERARAGDAAVPPDAPA